MSGTTPKPLDEEKGGEREGEREREREKTKLDRCADEASLFLHSILPLLFPSLHPAKPLFSSSFRSRRETESGQRDGLIAEKITISLRLSRVKVL